MLIFKHVLVFLVSILNAFFFVFHQYIAMCFCGELSKLNVFK